MNLIILGPQGSGKGTQAELLAKEYSLFYFESGGFLREIAKTNSEIDGIVNKKGSLVPDDIMISLVSEYLSKTSPSHDNLLFDGYPRSTVQYDLLKKWLADGGKKIDLVIFLTISEGESIRRLSARRTCSNCGKVYNLVTNPPTDPEKCECGGKLIQREDDQPDVIKKRLATYRVTTEPLVKIFMNEGILEEVDGERSIETIFQDIKLRVEKRLQSKNI